MDEGRKNEISTRDLTEVMGGDGLFSANGLRKGRSRGRGLKMCPEQRSPVLTTALPTSVPDNKPVQGF